jgi:hypothetical protein
MEAGGAMAEVGLLAIESKSRLFDGRFLHNVSDVGDNWYNSFCVGHTPLQASQRKQ